MTFLAGTEGLTKKTMLGAAARPWHRWVPESAWHLARSLRQRLGGGGREGNVGRQ